MKILRRKRTKMAGKIQIIRMRTPRGGIALNQEIIQLIGKNERRFISYGKVIAIEKFNKGKKQIYLDKSYWDYSSTTGYYRNMFLGETIKETRKKIMSKEYKLKDLNS